MEQDYLSEKKWSPRMIVSPQLLIPITVAGILIVVISIIFEYYSRKQDYLNLLENQAVLFTNALVNNSQSTLQAADVLESEIQIRMLSNLHLISDLHDLNPFLPSQLNDILQESQFDRIDIYAPDGKIIVRAADSLAITEKIPSDIIAAINEGLFEEIILTSEDSLGSSTGRFTALVHRQEGGSVAGIVRTEYIQTFRQLYGFGRLLQEFKKTEGIEYVALENPEAIIAGIFEPYELSAFSEDNFLEKAMKQDKILTRIIPYEQHSIYEAAAPFTYIDETIGVLRLGISMKPIEILITRAKRGLAVTGILILVMSITLLSFYLSYRHRQLLRDAFVLLQKYTNLILENMGSGVIAVGKNGSIQLVNKQAAFIIGVKQEEIHGQTIEIFPKEMAHLCRESISTGKEFRQPNYIWYERNSNRRRIGMRTTLLQKDENIETCILMLDDITEQARLEERLQQQERLTAMGKLAASVAHEIRNPLNSIGMIIQLLDKKFVPTINKEQYTKYVQTVENEVYRINDIVNQFIKFARPPEIKRKPLDFTQFFKEIEVLFQSRMQENNINFELKIEPHPLCSGDSNQLKQVFINLIENCIQAINPPGKISIIGKAINNYYEIMVQDTGLGISEENLSHIFDLYFTTKKKGTGIGLAVVHQIIITHGGTIEVESKPAKGTNFIIQFPYSKKEKEQ